VIRFASGSRFVSVKGREVARNTNEVTITNRGLIFAVSLGLNLALAGAALRLGTVHRTPKPATPVERVDRIEFVQSSVSGSNPASPTTATYATNRFNWATVESSDWEQLAANLRAAGCPEKTIRDVVVGRARRALDRLSRNKAPTLPFWTGGMRRARANREAERAAAQVRQEIIARVQRVVGQDGFTEDGKMMEDFLEQAIARFVSGPMPEETFLRLTASLARDEARQNELSTRCQGIWLAEDDLEQKKNRAQFQRDLATVLSPAELEEFRARTVMMKLGDQVEFEATDLKPAEVRQIALITSRYKADLSLDGWFSNGEMTEEQEAQLQAAVRAYLGETRSVQYERAADGEFKSLFELGRDNNLPPEAAVKAFEIRKLAQQEVTRLRDDRSLSDAVRGSRLAQVQDATSVAVLQELGASACLQYLQHSGSWVTNVNGL
jgi:hypothetical protein